MGYTASDLAPLLEKATGAISVPERAALASRIARGTWRRNERGVLDSLAGARSLTSRGRRAVF